MGQDCDAFAWTDYIHDQRKVSNIIRETGDSEALTSTTRALALFQSALNLAKAEGVDITDVIAEVSSTYKGTTMPERNTEVARLMLNALGYGAARGMRLDMACKEAIAHVENVPDAILTTRLRVRPAKPPTPDDAGANVFIKAIPLV